MTPNEIDQSEAPTGNADQMGAAIGRRVVVVGSTCSGKTTLAARLAQALEAPHVELDAIYWGPNWTAKPEAEMRREVGAAVAGEAWVVDGNYEAVVRDLVWPRAETVVWLDYGLATIYRRLLGRTWRRWRSGEELWNGNRERLSMHLKWDGLPIWVLRTYWSRRRVYRRSLSLEEHAHLRVVRQRNPVETERWLRELDAPPRILREGRESA